METGSSYSSASQVEDSEPENLAPPPKADFHAFIDRVRQYLGIDDPAKTEDYKLGSRLGRDPNMFRMEQSSRPPSLKLPLMDDLAKLLQNQDAVVKPGPSSSTSLDIGQFLSNPPNRGNWYPVAGDKFEQRPQVVPQAFSNIARPGYKGLPTGSINQRELVKLELMVRECIATSNFLSTLSTASESTLNNLRAARDQREKTFTLLASEPDPNNRDQFLQQLLNSTLEDTPQMQFMIDISRSTAVAYQHLLEKFFHFLTNLVLICRDAYLKNADNSLDSYRLKNLRAAPISGPDLFERSLMQEYEQHLIGLGVKTGKAEERTNKGGFTLFPLHNTSCLHSFTPSKHRGVVFVAATEVEDLAGAEARTTVALKASNKHKTNDIPQSPPPPQSWTTSFNPFRASLGTQQTTGSIREHLPTREAKDSEHPYPTGGGKDSVMYS